MRSLVALVLVCACGDDGGGSVTPDAPVDGDGSIDAPVEVAPVLTSGSRLRARFLVGAGGERSFQGWHDTQLDIDCDWTFEDEPRCWPSTYPTSLFADAACTEPVHQQYDFQCEQLPDYISDYGGCASPRNIFRRGDAFAPTTLYSQTNAGCDAYLPDGNATYYRSVADPNAATYVRGSIVTRGPGRVQTRAVAGADGSIQPLQPYDTTFAAICYPNYGTGDPDIDVCRPDSHTTIWSDAADCSTPLAFVEATCPAKPFIYLYPLGVFRRGAEYTGDPEALEIYRQASGQCTPLDRGTSGTERIYQSGEAITTAQQVAVTRVRDEAAPDRLQPYSLAVASYQEATGKFYDTTLASDCELQRTGAAQWRCIPPRNPIVRDFFFTDAACTTRIDVITGYSPGALAMDYGSDCEEYPVHAFMQGAELPTLYRDNTGECLLYPATGTPNYAIGAEVSLDMFAELTPMTD